MKTVIIGGVAGGATAAARLRRLDEKAQIIIFERSGYISYATCGMPYYIGGIIENENSLTLQTPQSFYKRFRIDVRIKSEVVKINTENKTVTVHNLDTNEKYDESYDKLILSPGAKPVIPNVSGCDSSKIFTVRTIEDTFAVKDYIDVHRPKTAAVIGGGFIGIEMAENLHEFGMSVYIIEQQPQLLNILDKDMASLIHTKLRDKGIKLMLGNKVCGFEDKTDGTNIIFEDKPEIKADIIILSIGVSPESALAKNAGIELWEKDAILVNEHMETSIDDIFAIGDAVAVKHGITGNETLISLAGPANKQGRIAAENICGINSSYKGSFGTSVLKIFDTTVAVTGINERIAKNMGIDYEKIILSPLSHANYYPDASAMTIKLLFEKQTMKILGAQIIGFKGVDKRIDIISTAMQSGLTADRLKDLELSYAPPYSSAKDPVNMAGCIADNLAKGLVKQFHYEELNDLQQRNDVTLLDTRTSKEYERGHAEGFINIPIDYLRDNLHKLDSSKPIYVMCQSGLRSYIACRILSQNGFDCFNFSGGYRFYSSVFNDTIPSKETYPCGMEK